MQAIVLLGAPGAGKGTAADGLQEEFGFLHVSTGNMLREAVAGGTDVGNEAEPFMQAGELVPDRIIGHVVEELLDSQKIGARYMFDGYPRTLTQADMLDASLDARAGELNHVFYLRAPRGILVGRLVGRRICASCGANYHLVNVQPKVEGVCDRCSGELYQRPDDFEETVNTRLNVYEEMTRELADHYEKRSLLQHIDSSRRPEDAVDDIARILRSSGPGGQAVSS